jgi:hypothetical protein
MSNDVEFRNCKAERIERPDVKVGNGEVFGEARSKFLPPLTSNIVGYDDVFDAGINVGGKSRRESIVDVEIPRWDGQPRKVIQRGTIPLALLKVNDTVRPDKRMAARGSGNPRSSVPRTPPAKRLIHSVKLGAAGGDLIQRGQQSINGQNKILTSSTTS